MAKRIIGTTPKEDGFRMPGEFEAQDQIFMIWPNVQITGMMEQNLFRLPLLMLLKQLVDLHQ